MKNPGTGPGLFLANCKAYNIGIVQYFRWHDAISLLDVIAQLESFDYCITVVHKQLRITSTELAVLCSGPKHLLCLFCFFVHFVSPCARPLWGSAD